MSTPDPTKQPPGTRPLTQPNPPPSPSNDTSSSSTQQLSGPPDPTLAQQARMRKLIYNSSVVICVACPILVLMPPRKLDLFTFGLGVAFCTSAGFVLEQRTGRGLLWHVSTRLPSVRKRERERLAREKEAEEALRDRGQTGQNEVLARFREEDEAKVRARGLVKRVWMGGQGDDWVEKRKKEELDALDEGKGYGSLILGQIKEVFGGKKKDDDDEDDEDDENGNSKA